MSIIVPYDQTPAGAGPMYLASIPTWGITPSAVTPSSEQTAYPALNVTDYGHPQRPWKPSTTGDENLVVNLGSLLNLGAIHLGWLNPDTCSDFKIQAHATNSWGSPTVD